MVRVVRPSAIVRCADHGRLVINHVVFAEVSVGFDEHRDARPQLSRSLLRARARCPGRPRSSPARRSSSTGAAAATRRSPLPDFYIGAHAAVAGMSLLTRDAARYRTYFPTVELIAPDV